MRPSARVSKSGIPGVYMGRPDYPDQYYKDVKKVVADYGYLGVGNYTNYFYVQSIAGQPVNLYVHSNGFAQLVDLSNMGITPLLGKRANRMSFALSSTYAPTTGYREATYNLEVNRDPNGYVLCDELYAKEAMNALRTWCEKNAAACKRSVTRDLNVTEVETGKIINYPIRMNSSGLGKLVPVESEREVLFRSADDRL